MLCAGDQDRPTDRPIVAAVTRWQPHGEIPGALRTALEAIQFEVRPFGVYTLRDVVGSHREYFVAVSPERLIAINRAFIRGEDTIRNFQHAKRQLDRVARAPGRPKLSWTERRRRFPVVIATRN
jgi:hypothetical protein